ncbi:MAG: hypothetical protein IPL19_34155 [Sandaracinaceae bacterium]|nr:hypothetical protein [Sandaracinaceae bacterium]
MTRLPEPEAPESDAPLNQREAAKRATQRAVLAAARDSFEELGFRRQPACQIAGRAQESRRDGADYYGTSAGCCAALFEELDAAPGSRHRSSAGWPNPWASWTADARGVRVLQGVRPTLSRGAARVAHR